MQKRTGLSFLAIIPTALIIGCGTSSRGFEPSFHPQVKTLSTDDFWAKVDGAYTAAGGAVVTFEKTTRSFYATIPSTNFTAAPISQADVDVLAQVEGGVCTLKISSGIESVETVPELLTYSSLPHLILDHVAVELVYNVDDRSVSQHQRTLCSNERIFWSNLKDLEITNYSNNLVKLGIKWAVPSNADAKASIESKLDELRTFKR